MEKEFLSRFEEEQMPYALELLDLARASYRLRDDDNIYLGKIEGQVLTAVEEGSRRIRERHLIEGEALKPTSLSGRWEQTHPSKKQSGRRKVPSKQGIFSSRRDRCLVNLQDPESQLEKRGSSSTPPTFSVFRRERSLCAMP